MYEFREQLKKGEDCENILDEFYRQWFVIKPVSMNAQRSGIDRAWTDTKTDIRYSVEYKTDWTAASTGNAFIETWSIEGKKRGWAYTSSAQILIYFIPPMNIAYRTTPMAIKNKIKEWQERYNEKTIPNDGYNTLGIPVPIQEFETCCFGKDNIVNGQS